MSTWGRTIEQVKKDEGYRERQYICPTGHATIGYGWKISSGLSKEAAEAILIIQLRECREALLRSGKVRGLDEERLSVLTQMSFQLGVRGCFNFVKMWRAIENRDFTLAAAEMVDSNWHKQTPARCERLAGEMERGGQHG